MFCLFHPDMIKIHIKEKTLKRLENSSDIRREIYNRLTVGVNVVTTDSYQQVAEWLLNVPEEKLKEITVEDVVKGVGEYFDVTGYLI